MGVQLQKQKTEGPEVKKPNLTGIPTQMKLDFERRSGLSFDDVRVHYNSDKPARLGALAYTQGTQVHVGPGQERSLPHELGHVIQQKAGRVRPTRWIGGLPVNDQPELEHEADLAPVQCMPAPGLWGVVQMALPEMPHQRGPDCGYHALARALLKFQKNGTVKLPYTENNLELYLTSYAIQNGFSLVGEAFDPSALVHVGNQFCKDNGIPSLCSLLSYQNEAELERILVQSSQDGSVILFPYFSGPNLEPVPNIAHEKMAHWSAIDTEEKTSGGEETTSGGTVSYNYNLYEGNKYGSIIPGSKKLLPLGTDPKELFDSNNTIEPGFDWSHYAYKKGLLKDRRLSGPVVEATEVDYQNYCHAKKLSPTNITVKNKYLLSEECKNYIQRNAPELYQEILSTGASGISDARNGFAASKTDFESFPGLISQLRTVINHINFARQENGLSGDLSFDPTKGTQGVTLKGYAVKVQRKT